MRFNLVLILYSLVILFSNSCIQGKDCKKYLIPERDLKAFKFMNDSTKSLVYTNSKGASHTFQLDRTYSSISNPNCNKFELGKNQYEKKSLKLNSNDFPVDISETSKCKFSYSVNRDRDEDSLTNYSLLLGDFRYVISLQSDEKIKASGYNDPMGFWMKRIDSFYVFSENAFNRQIDSTKSYVSKVYWSNKHGLVGYELNNRTSFLLDTIIKKKP